MSINGEDTIATDGASDEFDVPTTKYVKPTSTCAGKKNTKKKSSEPTGVRACKTCSICSSTEHTKRKCPDYVPEGEDHSAETDDTCSPVVQKKRKFETTKASPSMKKERENVDGMSLFNIKFDNHKNSMDFHNDVNDILENREFDEPKIEFISWKANTWTVNSTRRYLKALLIVFDIHDEVEVS